MQLLPIFHLVLQRRGTMRIASRQFRTSQDVAAVLREYLAEVDREHFVVIALDRKNRMLGLTTVSIGSLTASVVHPREVMKFVILANAAAFICGHNHPSGNTWPSREDKALTQSLLQAARLFGIPLLDHVIIGHDTEQYTSFADENLLRAEDYPLIAAST